MRGEVTDLADSRSVASFRFPASILWTGAFEASTLSAYRDRQLACGAEGDGGLDGADAHNEELITKYRE
jgi:hypothetical protein